MHCRSYIFSAVAAIRPFCTRHRYSSVSKHENEEYVPAYQSRSNGSARSASITTVTAGFFLSLPSVVLPRADSEVFSWEVVQNSKLAFVRFK